MNGHAIEQAGSGNMSTARSRVLFAGCLAHLTHDGLTDMLLTFFPVWQQMFSLSFVEVGLLKTLFSGTLAGFQIPAGTLAGRLGPRLVLLAGTMLACLALFSLSFATAPLALWFLLVAGGLGSSVQHPLASSAISRVYSGKSSRAALSGYNFVGDVGKLLVPATAALLIAHLDWRMAMRILTLAALGAGLVVFAAMGNVASDKTTGDKAGAEPGRANRPGLTWPFWSMSAIGVIDSATRMGFLTFFPFLLRDKGADMPTLGLALGLIFAGGAAGKLVCGMAASRVGILRSVILTEAATAAMILLMVMAPLGTLLMLCPLLGVVLNGTSSVLYGSVPELVAPQARNRAFACFYTGTIGAGAVSPFFYGLLSDMVGLDLSLKMVALLVLATVPLTIPLRGRLND